MRNNFINKQLDGPVAFLIPSKGNTMNNCESCGKEIKTTITFDKSKGDWCSMTACDCNVLEITRSKHRPKPQLVVTEQVAPKIFTLSGKPATLCIKCNSASLVAKIKDGLCVVCYDYKDAKRLELEDAESFSITAPEVGSLEEEGVETEALENMGLDPLGLNEIQEDKPITLTPAEAMRAKYGLTNNKNEFFKAASVPQIGALKKLGWDMKDLILMKLSMRDASQLLQKGPKWLLK